MEIECPKCKCRIADGELAKQLAPEQFQELIAKRIEDDARAKVASVIEKEEKRVTSYWTVVRNAVAVVAAVVVGVVGFSFWNVSESSGKAVAAIEKEAAASQTAMNSLKDEVVKAGASAKDAASKALNDIQRAASDLQLSSNLLERTKATSDEIQKKLSALGDIESRYNQLQQDTKYLQNRLTIHANSFFDITVQAESTNRVAPESPLISVLQTNGFLVAKSAILYPISVDRSEVIYYHESSQDAASKILGILRAVFPELAHNPRLIPGGDPRNILVKLK